MGVLSRVFLAGSPRCFASLRRSLQPRKGEAREICKWKPLRETTVEFSRSITARIRFPECFLLLLPLLLPLLSLLALRLSPLVIAFLPPISLFQSSAVSRRRRTSSLHFLLCPFSDLRCFPFCHDALYFRFCLYFRFPFFYVSLRFFAITTYLPPRSPRLCTLDFLSFLFFFLLFASMLSPFLPYLTISVHALSPSVTEFCTASPVGELSFVSCVADVYSSCSTPIRLPE